MDHHPGLLGLFGRTGIILCSFICSTLKHLLELSKAFFFLRTTFELFKGKFHKNYWFALSWGMLPFLAGFVIQTNTLTPISLFLSLIPFILSYIEIRISRLYKYNKRNNSKPMDNLPI